jgi:hypothetical protein
MPQIGGRVIVVMAAAGCTRGAVLANRITETAPPKIATARKTATPSGKYPGVARAIPIHAM